MTIPKPVFVDGGEGEIVMINGTARQYLNWYAKGSGVTVKFLREAGRVPRYVSGCEAYRFYHWELGRDTDDDWDRRYEVDQGLAKGL